MNNVARLEPNEDDFISPILMEAALVSRVLTPSRFATWLSKFLPTIPENMVEPVVLVDKKDPKSVHAVGLNLSRAWCFFIIARKLEGEPSQHAIVIKNAAVAHLKEGLENVKSGEYSGEHWLGTFAVLALTECIKDDNVYFNTLDNT
jgi:Protein of unknown function (DUF2891)